MNDGDLKTLFTHYLRSLELIAPEKARFVKYEAAHRCASASTSTDARGPWTYTHGADCVFGDIRRLEGAFTLGDLFEAALTTPSCVGFTTTGWLKHRLSPLSHAGYAKEEGVFTLL